MIYESRCSISDLRQSYGRISKKLISTSNSFTKWSTKIINISVNRDRKFHFSFTHSERLMKLVLSGMVNSQERLMLEPKTEEG